MGTLSVGLIFRHFISGAVFIAPYYFSKGALQSPGTLLDSLNQRSAALGIAALLIGTMIYSLHRAITNPVLEWFRHLVMARCRAETPNQRANWLRRFIFPSSIQKLMFDRWNAGQDYRPTPAHISSWGDYVHLQYTTAWAFVLGSLSAWYLAQRKGDWHPSWEISLLFLVFLVSGFYTDCRKHVVEEEFYKQRKRISGAI